MIIILLYLSLNFSDHVINHYLPSLVHNTRYVIYCSYVSYKVIPLLRHICRKAKVGSCLHSISASPINLHICIYHYYVFIIFRCVMLHIIAHVFKVAIRKTSLHKSENKTESKTAVLMFSNYHVT